MEKTQAQLHQQAIAQLREDLEKMGTSSQMFGEKTLMRFLVARCMDPGKAAKMIVEWQKWRAGFVPLGYIPDDQIPDELQPRKIYLQSPTKCGRALVVVLTRNHTVSKDQLQLQRFIVHLLDKTIASAIREEEVGDEKLVVIIDLQNISYRNIDARALITGFQFLQAYYPERLARLYFLSMPWIFVSVWKFVRRFLEKATLEKIVVINSEEERKALIEEIGEDSLPQEYGGRAKLTAIQDVKVNHLPLKK